MAKTWQKVLGLLLLVFGLLALILPKGVRSAAVNNVWSVRYIKSYNNDSFSPGRVSEAHQNHPHAVLLQAREAIEKRAYGEAFGLMETIIPTSDPVILETYAELLFLSERYQESFEIWKQLGKYIKLYYVSVLLKKENQLDNSIMALSYAYDLRPDIYGKALANEQLMAASLLRDKGFFEEAEGKYREVITQFPENGRAYLELGLCQLLVGQEEEAISLIDKAMELNLTDSRHYIRAAQVYEKTGVPDKALIAYQKALALDPENKDALAAVDRLMIP